jgi:hypothetical protein
MITCTQRYMGTNVCKEYIASNITEKATTIWICENVRSYTNFIFSHSRGKRGERVNVKVAQAFSKVGTCYAKNTAL